MNALLKNKLVNEWNLFWLVAAPVSAVIIFTMARTDLSNGEGISSLIQLSVRFAVPFLPFLPLFIIALGIVLAANSRAVSRV